MSTEPSTADELLVDIRAALQTRPRWTNDYAATKFGALLNRAHDRIEALLLPHDEVLRLAECDDGVDSAALMKALCKKVEGQRKHINALEMKLKEAQQLAMRQANEIRSLTHDINRALRNHTADLSEVRS